MLFTLTKRVEFCAAHSIKGAGKCERKHGHNWEATIQVSADALNEQGFIADVAKIKQAAFQYDHDDLDNYFSQPTTELVAQAIADEVLYIVKAENTRCTAVTVHVLLVETRNNSALQVATWPTWNKYENESD